MFCDFCVHHMPYKQGRDAYPSDGWWTFWINDGDLSFLRWILILLELGLRSVMMKICGCFSCECFVHVDLAFFLTGRWHHQIPSKSIKRGVRFIPSYVRVQEHAIFKPNPTSADTVNIPRTTVIWHDWSQLVQDVVQPLMLHLPS